MEKWNLETPMVVGFLLLAVVSAISPVPAAWGQGGPAGAARKQPPASLNRILVLPATHAVQFRLVAEEPKLWLAGDIDLEVTFSAAREVRVEDLTLTSALVRGFVASRKFQVLERAELKSLIKELDLGDSKYGDSEAVVKLGEMWNADYALVTSISAVHLQAEKREVPYVGGDRLQLLARLDLYCRIIQVGTSRVMWAARISSETEKEWRADGEFRRAQFDELVDQLYTVVSRQVVDQAIEAVFPVKVVAVEGQEIYINRGAQRVRPGNAYIVYRTGPGIIDPDTGEKLGSTENALGEVVVVRVLPKMAIAKAAGQAIEVQVGDLCREKEESVKERTRISPRSTIDW